MNSQERRQDLGHILKQNLDRLLEVQSKTSWWLTHRIRDLDGGIASHSTLCAWFTGRYPRTHRIPAVALPIIAKALRCGIADLFREARWVRCECCERRYWCKLHDRHLDECSCEAPALETIQNG